MATPPLSDALFREVAPGFFRVLTGSAAGLYLDALDRIGLAARDNPAGMDRDDALALVEQAVEAHRDTPLEEGAPALPARERARLALDHLRDTGWLEEEERSNWQRLIHFHPNGLHLLQTLHRIAYPGALVFSDRLVSVCNLLAGHENPESDPFPKEPWQHVESCIAALQEGIAELRGMQTAIERHTRRQLATATLRENLTILFDRFAEQIGRACYAELVRARLPLRLAEARRRVEELVWDVPLQELMREEVLRRHASLSPEAAAQHVRSRLEELAGLLQLVVPVADAVDRRTAEFTRRSLARFRYLQETASENRSHVQTFFEQLNHHFAGQRLGAVDEEALEIPAIRLHETRLPAGVHSLYTPRLRRSLGEIEPLDEAATEYEQDAALLRLQGAMRDSLTVGRANRFIDNILPEEGALSSEEIPLHCEEDLADLIACLLHSGAADARYRVAVPRREEDADRALYDAHLSYRVERFTLSRK